MLPSVPTRGVFGDMEWQVILPVRRRVVPPAAATSSVNDFSSKHKAPHKHKHNLPRPRASLKKPSRGRTGDLMPEAAGSGACEKRLALPTGGLQAPGSSSKQATVRLFFLTQRPYFFSGNPQTATFRWVRTCEDIQGLPSFALRMHVTFVGGGQRFT